MSCFSDFLGAALNGLTAPWIENAPGKPTGAAYRRRIWTRRFRRSAGEMDSCRRPRVGGAPAAGEVEGSSSRCPKSRARTMTSLAATSTSWQTHTHTHPFNGPFSTTTQVSRYQKGKTNLDFTEATDSEWQWHQLGHMQVCTSLQTDNHTSTPTLRFLQAGCPSCRPTNSVKALKANTGQN